jgi:hypothetical protein
LISIVIKCLKLENINVRCCLNITDLSLIEISKNCLKLKKLEFYRCESISFINFDELKKFEKTIFDETQIKFSLLNKK